MSTLASSFRKLLNGILVMLLSASACSWAATFTWDGGGTNNSWETANNWNPNAAPDRTSGHDLHFAGTTRLSADGNSGNWTLNSITFDSGAGAFTLSNGGVSLGAGGVTNNSTNTQTINNQLTLSDHQTWNAANGAIVSGTSYLTGNSKDLTLTGSSSITMNGQLGGLRTLETTGSGTRTFNGQIAATTINLASTGTNNLNGQINVGSLNISAGTSNIANAQVSTGTYVSGAANVNFTGPVTGGGGITLNTSGNVNFNGNINSGSLTLNGSGTTTISGNGSMSTGAVVVNNGTLIMDHTGSAINSTLTVNSGGTVVFAQDNQVPAWQTVTLNEGSTLDLGNTSQTFAKLVINGDSVIDFGGDGSQLNITYGGITITEDVTITILNWNEEVGDSFFGQNINNSGYTVQVQYADNDGNIYANGTWTGSGNNNGNITPGAPIPEPAAYGAFMLASGVALVLLCRRGRPPHG